MIEGILKHYFISYGWARHGKGSDGSANYSEDLTSEHPIAWLIRVRKDCAQGGSEYDGSNYDYWIMFWAEVDEHSYLAYKDQVG